MTREERHALKPGDLVISSGFGGGVLYRVETPATAMNEILTTPLWEINGQPCSRGSARAWIPRHWTRILPKSVGILWERTKEEL